LTVLGRTKSAFEDKRSSWGEIYYDKEIRSWIWSKSWFFSGGNYHTAQDLSQEAWWKIGEASHNYKSDECPFAWYTSVVLNHLRNLTKNQEGRWKRLSRYNKGTRSEDVLGDDPNLPPLTGF